ncbi:hypothetical protein ABID14_001465 [Peptoniphilus olsenii]|uniref:Uncharacterized protein n=1 Tax=Peptoniphilus olsenii TaxID=411570 RepID=A0ABV2JAJ6_9FIRM
MSNINFDIPLIFVEILFVIGVCDMVGGKINLIVQREFL